jgi:hypothetical protein
MLGTYSLAFLRHIILATDARSKADAECENEEDRQGFTMLPWAFLQVRQRSLHLRIRGVAPSEANTPTVPARDTFRAMHNTWQDGTRQHHLTEGTRVK